MALMEERAGRIETARALFIQATKTDKSSAASWLVGGGWHVEDRI